MRRRSVCGADLVLRERPQGVPSSRGPRRFSAAASALPPRGCPSPPISRSAPRRDRSCSASSPTGTAGGSGRAPRTDRARAGCFRGRPDRPYRSGSKWSPGLSFPCQSCPCRSLISRCRDGCQKHSKRCRQVVGPSGVASGQLLREGPACRRCVSDIYPVSLCLILRFGGELLLQGHGNAFYERS